MISSSAKLVSTVFAKDSERASTRDGFGTGSVEAGKINKDVVVLCADLKESTRAQVFEDAFPDRYIEIGVAEQNLATVAAGMAAVGKVPFIASYAAFSPGRNYEQIRTTIALNNRHVIICGMHAGLSVGPDGATHQMLEDIGLMRMLPGMTVIVPGDAEEARKAVVAAALHDGPVYIRFGRSTTPVFTTVETPFALGKALLVWESDKPKVALIATGALTHEALLAARALAVEGIEVSVLHVSSIKPLDTEALVALARKAGRVVTIEEHQRAGGLGSAVAECLSEQYPVPVLRMGVKDQFGQSGTPEELMDHYGLSATHIADTVRSLVNV
jgi:transketolase